ncbi:hypothetical protein QR77_16960 [Streptomyces sp. 150FB]|uniref:hypothetical protein n=1 Tax=Streptomyces sp. 150FB TaxID=1576605 RepID=UPI000588F3D4|nr:hypothetical protein [Streptomyces sp. 150FB]KIF75156.1 hypothetical protein QR77_16960 [Streptomyces sp. 150FB]
MMTTGKQLPRGWILEEIRTVFGDREATPLDTDRVATGWPGQDERLHPDLVLGFHELCTLKTFNDDLWYLGAVNDEVSITC